VSRTPNRVVGQGLLCRMITCLLSVTGLDDLCGSRCAHTARHRAVLLHLFAGSREVDCPAGTPRRIDPDYCGTATVEDSLPRNPRTRFALTFSRVK
jgi:hypothetical protein